MVWTQAHSAICVMVPLAVLFLADATPAVVVEVAGRPGVPSMRVAADVGSSSSFRLSVEFLDGQPTGALAEPLFSPSLDFTRDMANGTRTSGPEGEGIRTSFGELLIAKDGRFTLKDTVGNVVARASGPPVLAKETPGHDSITMPVSGSKTGPGANGRRPCLVNGAWGPTFTWDPVDKFFAFAVSPWLFDPDYIHCYPVSFDGLAPLKSPPQDSCTTITHVVPLPGNFSRELPGSPMKLADGVSCCGACNDHSGCTAWMVDNKKNLCHFFSCVDQWVPPDTIGGDDNQFLSGGVENYCADRPLPSPSESIGGYIHQDGWFGLGKRMDWYLAPTPTGGFDFTKALFDLTGAPAVPPLYGMGFMATYWGYTSMQQVEQYMREFRDRKLPIDSFIMDYDWFHDCEKAGDYPPQGGLNCGDYGYRKGWWDNITFNQSDGTVVHCETPADVFEHFHTPPLSMHFGGIRKPRTYSNKKLCQTNGWLLPNVSDVGEGGDINFNFSIPEMRAWYSKTHAHFIDDGMDFWWNDEGETAWFTYLLWNEAQADQWKANRPNTRHFTLNRAWQPGMQRFPAISWTGDGQSCTHQELLKGMMNGCPLTSCDLTSPDATTLVRQYQSAVFTPIMRVHMMQGTPRFPWFWPNSDSIAPALFAEFQEAFQTALGMRYTFLPFIYSLAHAQYRHGRPIGHPASFAFPTACVVLGSQECTDAENTYMVGGVLIPSDLGLAHTNVRVDSPTGKHPPHENMSVAILPAASHWYRWNTTTALQGGQTVKQTLQLAEMAVYVLAGAILPLQANGSIQRSAEVGGLLEVQIYAGSDGKFVMVEDDGISLDYSTSPDAGTRTTTWRWSDASKTLTWSVEGGKNMHSPNLYSAVSPVLFEAGVAEPQRADHQALTASGGKVTFREYAIV